MKSMTTETIATSFGPAVVQVINSGGAHVQYNCFLPPCGGAGIFAMMSADLSSNECSDAMRALIELGPHAENLDLTSTHRNLEAAGTVNMAQINVSEAIRNQRSATQQFARGGKPGCKSATPCRECEKSGIRMAKPAISEEEAREIIDSIDNRTDLSESQRLAIRRHIAAAASGQPV